MDKKIILYVFIFLVCSFLTSSELTIRDYTSKNFLQGFQLNTLPPIMKKYLLPADNVIPGSEKLFYKRSFNVWDQNNEKLKKHRNEKLFENRKRLKQTVQFERKIRMKPKREYEDLFTIYDELKPEVKDLMDANKHFVEVRQR